MATKRLTTQPFRAKVRGKDSRMEYEGSIEQGIHMSFYYIDDPVKRQNVMAELYKAHQKLLGNVDDPQADAAREEMAARITPEDVEWAEVEIKKLREKPDASRD